MQVYGVDILIRFCSHLTFIYLAFWSLQALRLEAFFQKQKTTQLKILLLLVAIGLGYMASQFFLEIIILSKNLVTVGF